MRTPDLTHFSDEPVPVPEWQIENPDATDAAPKATQHAATDDEQNAEGNYIKRGEGSTKTNPSVRFKRRRRRR